MSARTETRPDPAGGGLPAVPATIEAERLTLRPLRRSDAGLLRVHAGDARVARMTSSIPHPYPPGAAEAFIAQSAGKTVWAIDGAAAGLPELVGTIDLRPVSEGQCEIGYWVAPDLWNLGLASEAVGALVAANPVGCRTLFGTVFQDNPASARVLTHAGFDYIGDAETYCVAREAKVATWTYLRRMG